MKHLKRYKIFESDEHELDSEDIKNIFFSCYEEFFDNLLTTNDTTNPRMEFLENNTLSEKIKNNTFIIEFVDYDDTIVMNVMVRTLAAPKYTNGTWRPFDLTEFEGRISPYKLHSKDSVPSLLKYNVKGNHVDFTVESTLVRAHTFVIKK